MLCFWDKLRFPDSCGSRYGLCKLKISEINMEVGEAHTGLTWKKILNGKSSENSLILVVLIFGVVYHVHFTLLKVVSHYDLSVLSMSVMGFQKANWIGVGSN